MHSDLPDPLTPSTFCVLTPSGPGAVAVIAVDLGSNAEIGLVLNEFRVGSSCELSNAAIGRILFGTWRGEDLVVVRTTNRRWEIHCHGGAVAVRRITQDLTTAGVLPEVPRIPPVESFRVLTEHVTTETLLKCRTRRAAGLVLAQQDGRLLKFASQLQSLDEAERRAAQQHLQKWQPVAEHITKPWRIAVVGEPNVGKSSLINAVAGLQRSIVSSTPGTTRDRVEVDVVIRGWMFRFIDTAGIRIASESLPEHLGIELSLTLLTDCDLICLVMDATCETTDSTLTQRLQSATVPICIVRNKCDILENVETLTPMRSASNVISGYPSAHSVNISARTGLGISELLAWIAETAVPEEPSTDLTLPFAELFGQASDDFEE